MKDFDLVSKLKKYKNQKIAGMLLRLNLDVQPIIGTKTHVRVHSFRTLGIFSRQVAQSQ